MNKLTLKSSFVLLAGIAVLSGCTVNHYHLGASNPNTVDDSLLVIPEIATEFDGGQSSNNDLQSSPRVALPDQVLSMSAKGSGDNDSVRYMDSVRLEVQSNVDAYLNCFHKQADGAIIKVFPNRYARRYWVYASQRLNFPDEKYFKFLANTVGSSEGFICLLSEEDVLSKLPGAYKAPIFQKLPIDDFDAVYALYDQATEENLVARVVSYNIEK